MARDSERRSDLRGAFPLAYAAMRLAHPPADAIERLRRAEQLAAADGLPVRDAWRRLWGTARAWAAQAKRG